MNTAIQLLTKVLHVIDTTDPESDDFIDSGADSVSLLHDIEEDIRDFIFEQTGVYPQSASAKFDFDAENVPTEWD